MATEPSLLSNAYAPGEFAQLQQQFDTAVFEFSAHLREPVERALRAAMAQDIASVLPQRAAAVERFLRGGMDSPPADTADPPEKAAELARLRQELASLGPALELDEPTVAEEVEACSGELAHHTLALWFATLRRALKPGAGSVLNANMLPGHLSMHEVLHDLDVDAFGVKTDTVIQALTRYRRALRARAVQSGALIAFADDLLIAVGRDEKHPYTLYASELDQWAQAPVPAGAARPPQQAGIRMRMIKLAQRIDMAVSTQTAAIGRYEQLVDAALADPRGGRFRVGDLRVTLPSAMGRGVGATDDAPASLMADELLAYPIESVADVVAAGGSGTAATERLNQRLGEVPAQLEEYAALRCIPFQQVSTAYAVFVAARAQPMVVDVQLWNEREGAAQVGIPVQEQVAQALDLSVDVSAMLMDDAGVEFGDWGLAQAEAPFTAR